MTGFKKYHEWVIGGFKKIKNICIKQIEISNHLLISLLIVNMRKHI